MTRKKIYTYFALLFCAPTALFSANDDREFTILGIKRKENDKPCAVFASTDLTLEGLLTALKQNSYEEQEKLEDIQELLLYKSGNEEGEVIWKAPEENEDPDSNQQQTKDENQNDSSDTFLEDALKTLKDPSKTLKDLTGEKSNLNANYTLTRQELQAALEAWCVGQKADNFKFPTQFTNLYNDQVDLSNEDYKKSRRILIIESNASGSYKLHKMAKLFVKRLTGTTYTVAIPTLLGTALNMTVTDLKKEIHKLTNIEPEYQRLIFNGKQLEDKRKLVESYNIQFGVSTVQLLMRIPPKKEVEEQNKTNLTNDASNTQEQLQGQPKNKVPKKNNIDPTNDPANTQTQLQDKDEDNIDHTNDASNTQTQLQGQPENKVPKKKNINLTNNASNTQIQQQGISTDNNQNGDEPQQNENSDEAPPLYTNPKIILTGICIIGCAVYITLNSKQVNNKTKRRHRAKQKA